MIRRLVAALAAVDLAPVLALAAVTWGLATMRDLAQDRHASLAQLDGLLATRRAELADLEAELLTRVSVVEYPAQVDLDPVGRAEETAPA